MDHTAKSHHGHPCVHGGQGSTPVVSLKNPENLGRDSIPITLGRVSSAFFLTKAFAGRINKKELIHANLWEGRVHPMPTSSHASFPAHDTGPCCSVLPVTSKWGF